MDQLVVLTRVHQLEGYGQEGDKIRYHGDIIFMMQALGLFEN